MLKRFAQQDISKIKTKDFLQYRDWVRQQDNSLKPATINHIASVVAKVLRTANHEGAIDDIPAIPRVKRKDNPRPSFKFDPLVSKEKDEYKLLLKTAREMADQKVRVRDTVVTDELRDFIIFMTHSFLRPTESEVYALTHKDVVVASDPKRLVLTIAKGKTGYRAANTMEAAASVYDRIKARNPNRKPEDYLFLPQYKNRSTAKRIVQRQFNALLEKCGLKQDYASKSDHTVYSLRHTAICMRLVLSHGEVNIFNLAKNAGTSVDQIERFYARNLPLGAEMARNLQSFGKKQAKAKAKPEPRSLSKPKPRQTIAPQKT